MNRVVYSPINHPHAFTSKRVGAESESGLRVGGGGRALELRLVLVGMVLVDLINAELAVGIGSSDSAILALKIDSAGCSSIALKGNLIVDWPQ